MGDSGASGLFLRAGGVLVALSEQPYALEDELQELLGLHPELLPGAQIDPEQPRRFLLIRREAQVAGMEIDHLFLDQDAIPTLVEVKRSANVQARREVVAQMLDYAANAATAWSGEKLATWLEDRCASDGLGLDDVLGQFEPSHADHAKFWTEVDENLRSGKVRLIFVADTVPPSLQRIVEFLNERMTPTEVLAVEVRQYTSGDDKHLLHTRLVGATSAARDVKRATRRPEVIPRLVEHGHLRDGDTLWLVPNILPAAVRPPADDPRLRVTLRINDGRATLLYQPDASQDVEELTPSTAWNRSADSSSPRMPERDIGPSTTPSQRNRVARRSGCGRRS
jgi:hypothetical protein